MTEFTLKDKTFTEVKDIILGSIAELEKTDNRSLLSSALFHSCLHGNKEHALMAYYNIDKSTKKVANSRALKKRQISAQSIKELPPELFLYPVARQLHNNEEIKEALHKIEKYLSITAMIRAEAIEPLTKPLKKATDDKTKRLDYGKRERIAILYTYNGCTKETPKKQIGEEEESGTSKEPKRHIAQMMKEAKEKTIDELTSIVDEIISGAKKKRTEKRREKKDKQATIGDFDSIADLLKQPYQLFNTPKYKAFVAWCVDDGTTIPEGRKQSYLEIIAEMKKLLKEDWESGYDALFGIIKRIKGSI